MRSISSERSGDPVQGFGETLAHRQMACAIDPPELLVWLGKREQFLAEADWDNWVLRPVHHKRRRVDRADQQVVVEWIAEQCANRDEPVCGGRDIRDRR